MLKIYMGSLYPNTPQQRTRSIITHKLYYVLMSKFNSTGFQILHILYSVKYALVDFFLLPRNGEKLVSIIINLI